MYIRLHMILDQKDMMTEAQIPSIFFNHNNWTAGTTTYLMQDTTIL